VSASLDGINADGRAYDGEWMAKSEEEVEHVDPFVVYMLPLVATTRGRPHGRSRRRKPRDELVQGLLLVKDKDATNKKWQVERRIEDSYTGKRERDVLFKRIGQLSSCPNREFERVTVKNIIIIQFQQNLCDSDLNVLVNKGLNVTVDCFTYLCNLLLLNLCPA
jgi:hypothetical protein